MVVVSWNMAKTQVMGLDAVLKRCEAWGASVLVVQEPTGSLISMGSQRRTYQPRGCEITWRGYLERGGSQGSIVIISREDVVISDVTSVDLGTGQGSRSITRTNPFVLFTATEDGERLTFGTCHSPFDESARAAYAQRAVAQGKQRNVDCILGDMNTYGTSVPGATRSRGCGYQCPQLGATSNRGKGSSLDKIFLLDKHTNFTAGRVIPGAARGIKRPRSESRNVRDIVDHDWSRCDSDHLPIFIAFNEQQDRIEKFFNRDHEPDDDDDSSEPPRKRRAGESSSTGRPIRV